MAKLKTVFYITCYDVETLTGIHWSKFKFSEKAENGSYQSLSCADWYLEELHEKLEDNDFKLKNEINLVETLRKQYGCRDTVLILVVW